MPRTLAVVVPTRPQRWTIVSLGLIVALIISSSFAAGVARGATTTAGPAGTTASADAPDRPLKAVIVVGPTHEMTDSNLKRGEELAVLAESYGMDVRRVFHPRATWENVLANVQGANLLVYMGHGYGWPSPYTQDMTESRQNGMGLNAVAGGSKSDVKYYGAKPIREQVTLAPSAVVFLNHLCYAAGNGESFMAIPGWDVARQRVDNFGAGFLAAGAKGVFAYSHQSGQTLLKSLHTTNKTMEQIFTTAGAYPHPSYGFIGWDARRFDSERTPGMKNYLDPHEKQGFLRAFTGDLRMTAAEWAGGTALVETDPPALSDLGVVAAADTVSLRANATPAFTPNGDGLTDSLTISHKVSEGAFLDFEVRDGARNVLRRFTTWSEAGSGQSVWNGRRDNGNFVADGTYTLTATPRDRAGNVGDPASLDVQVLTTMRAPAAAPALFFARDGDAYAPRTQLSVSLTTPAELSWKVVDAAGNTVRTHLTSAALPAGPVSWTWDGRDDAGRFVADGTYFSVMTASTTAGSYRHRVAVQAAAFSVRPKAASASAGQTVKFIIRTAEPLTGKPKLKVTAPGVATFTVRTTLVKPGKYRATVRFPAGASAGTVQLLVVGTDAAGQKQTTQATFPLN